METIAIGHAERMQIFCIKQGLEMHIKTGGQMLLTRTATLSNLLALLSRYTGKKYKRTAKAEGLEDAKRLLEEIDKA